MPNRSPSAAAGHTVSRSGVRRLRRDTTFPLSEIATLRSNNGPGAVR
jgi:hypothetical protein